MWRPHSDIQVAIHAARPAQFDSRLHVRRSHSLSVTACCNAMRRQASAYRPRNLPTLFAALPADVVAPLGRCASTHFIAELLERASVSTASRRAAGNAESGKIRIQKCRHYSSLKTLADAAPGWRGDVCSDGRVPGVVVSIGEPATPGFRRPFRLRLQSGISTFLLTRIFLV